MNEGKWQTLTRDADEHTEQLRVSGGWLFRTRTFEQRQANNIDGWDWFEVGVALAFQPEARS